MTEPVIGLDVDDVVADLLTPWLDRYVRKSRFWHGSSEEDYLTPDKLTSWDIDSQAKYPNLLREALHEVDYAREVKPIPGAVAAVEELRKMGRVIFVTACPQLYSAQPKYRWLQDNGFLPGDGSGQVDFFPARDKKMIRMDYLFDDADHNIKSCAEAGITSILVRRPHNRNFEWNYNIPGLYAAPGYLKGLLSGK